jgi:hypothetical protein
VSQKTLRPQGWLKVRRQARRIPDQATLDKLLEGASGLARKGMIDMLKPHLSFVPKEDPVEA